MKYISTSEVEKVFNVSRPTISKWVDDALNKVNNLQVIKVNTKVKIIDNPNNYIILQKLAQTASKHKPKTGKKITKPKEIFYDIYDSEQISSIYLNLLYKHQVDLKNVYKGDGQQYWDQYYHSKSNHTKVKTDELFNRFSNDLSQFICRYSKINIIDIGPGNGEPIKPVVKQLRDLNKLKSYIAVDISKEINRVTINNITKSFPDILAKDYIRDFETSHFSDILLANKDINGNEANLIFFIGSTINNCDDRLNIFKNLSNSLTKNDLIILTFTTDSPLNRAEVSYVNEGESTLAWKWLFELLGLDFDINKLESDYDFRKNRNELSLILDKDYIINFDIHNQVAPVNLFKNEKITFWKHYLINIADIIEDCKKCNLDVIEYKLDNTGTNGMVVLQVMQKS